MSKKKTETEEKQASLFESSEEIKKKLNSLDENQLMSQNNRITARYLEKTPEESRQEFFIPISGFVWLFPEEVEVVDHPMFQRLGNIYQLGQTYLVYRGATHKRIEHVLGTLQMVHRMISAIRYTSKKSRNRKEITGSPITPNEERFVRLGALLHDIGHVAAGHTLEDELCLIGKHDFDDRISLIFENKEEEWVDSLGRSLSETIDSEFSKYIPPGLKKDNIKASVIARLLIRKIPKDGTDKFKKKQEVLEKSNELRLSVCRDMIGNTICADLLDYLYRDWYHLGKLKTFDERILQYLEIKPDNLQGQVIQPDPQNTDRLVISLGKRPKIRTDAVSAILDLLESRYHLAESVLFHRTKISASAMLDRALYELWGSDPNEIENFILPLSDEQLVSECRRKARAKSNEVSYQILISIEKRQLYRTLCTYGYSDLSDPIRDNIQKIYVKNPRGPREAAKARANVLRNLEEDFKLPIGSIAMHCPSGKMNQKIALVRISVDDDMDKFCKYERDWGNPFSGGHLDAQIKRFERLWKIHFFINRKVYDDFNVVLDVLRETIHKLVLGCLRHEEEYKHACIRLATNLISLPKSPWEGHILSNEFDEAAYKSSDTIAPKYPSGAYCLRNFFKSKNG